MICTNRELSDNHATAIHQSLQHTRNHIEHVEISVASQSKVVVYASNGVERILEDLDGH